VSTTQTVNPITASSTGTYSVVGTDVAGCTGSASISVNVNQLPTITISAGVQQLSAREDQLYYCQRVNHIMNGAELLTQLLQTQPELIPL